jgi:hypothetical protein
MPLATTALFALITCSPKTVVRHRVVLELTSGGLNTYAHVLASATNLNRAFKDQVTKIEIVCHDDGIGLLRLGGHPFSARMKSLYSAGVTFVACGNTLRVQHLKTSALVPFATVVDSGVAEVVRKEEAGWSYLKAGN